MKLILACLLLISTTAYAGDYWGTVTLASYHVNPLRDGYNEKNFGAGVEYQDGDLLVTAGGYRNSFNRNSAYAMIGGLPINFGPFRIGGVVGLVNGYPRMNNGGIVPAAAGVIALEGEQAGVNLIIIPGIKEKTPLTIAVQVKVKF